MKHANRNRANLQAEMNGDQPQTVIILKAMDFAILITNVQRWKGCPKPPKERLTKRMLGILGIAYRPSGGGKPPLSSQDSVLDAANSQSRTGSGFGIARVANSVLT